MAISGCLMSQETAKKILVSTVPASDPDQHSHIQDQEEPVETLPSAKRGLGRRGRKISQGNCKVKHLLRCVRLSVKVRALPRLNPLTDHLPEERDLGWRPKMLLPEQPTRTAASELAAVLAIPPGSRWSAPGGHDQPCRVQTAAPSTGSWRPLLATVKTPSPHSHTPPHRHYRVGVLWAVLATTAQEKREKAEAIKKEAQDHQPPPLESCLGLNLLEPWLAVKVKVAQLCLTLCDPMDYIGFSSPEYWSG